VSRDADAKVTALSFGEIEGRPRVVLSVRERAAPAANLSPGAGGEYELSRPATSLRRILDAQQPVIGLVEAVGKFQRPHGAVDEPETVNRRKIHFPQRPLRQRYGLRCGGAGGGCGHRGHAQEIKLAGRPSSPAIAIASLSRSAVMTQACKSASSSATCKASSGSRPAGARRGLGIGETGNRGAQNRLGLVGAVMRWLGIALRGLPALGRTGRYSPA
jgi:hypothetical protein